MAYEASAGSGFQYGSRSIFEQTRSIRKSDLANVGVRSNRRDYRAMDSVSLDNLLLALVLSNVMRTTLIVLSTVAIIWFAACFLISASVIANGNIGAGVGYIFWETLFGILYGIICIIIAFMMNKN